MRRTFQGTEGLLKLKQSCAGKADDLSASGNQVRLCHPHGADNDDVPIVVAAIWRRASCEASICGLHNNDLVCRHTDIEDSPLLNKASGLHNNQRRATAESKACPVLLSGLRTRQHVAIADDGPQTFDQSVVAANAVFRRRWNVMRHG